jgi:xanthine dehydrogenase large subunit
MSAHHDSAELYVSGNAEYIDDRPLTAGEVHVDVFCSTHAKAKILSIDLSEAKKIRGVLGLYTAKDIAHNIWGTIFKDQPFLADQQVEYYGEPIVVIAAETKAALLAAKKKIQVQYQALPATLKIDQAIQNKEFIGPLRKIVRGNPEEALQNSEFRLKGEIEIAGQDHFYLESQACIAYPKEDQQIEIHASSQHPTEVQHLVCEALGLKHHQVVCVVKRMGGGFGGKESQAAPFAVYAALVAQSLNRPARLILTKDDDMTITGKRNPFKNFYEVGFDKEGRILALKAELYSDGGAYADLSTAIMERAMLHLDNAYMIPNFSVSGQVCKTNTASNTAFRGFGGPQGVVTIENIIEDIAQKLSLDSLQVREKNVYQKGQKTPYGQVIEDQVLPELFEKIKKQSNYLAWRKKIDAHNAQNSSTLHGLSVTAVKFGISFTTRFLNQGNALVNLHLDGTIQASTGATEMGQGVNTKIAQVLADCFSIPIKDVRLMPTSTEKTPNTSATAASSGADINAQAALNAALQLKENLSKVAVAVFARPENLRGKPTAGAGTAAEIDISQVSDFSDIEFKDGFVLSRKASHQKISFSDLLLEAYLNRVPLTAQGHFKYPGIFYNKETGQGQPFFYFTNGVAASEVSIDRLTGETKVLRSEILMDLGRPLNEGIDKGQVIGAFVQGMGWVTTENLFYNSDGKLLSISPSTYKIPSIHDIPRHLTCELIHNPSNEKNVKGSKAVGEPPLLLGISVWTAIKNALHYQHQKTVTLKLPATQEQVFQHLQESI